MAKRYDSGVPGVFWEKGRRCWTARISRDRKQIVLGQRQNLDEAIKLRLDAERGIFPSAEEKRQCRRRSKPTIARMSKVWHSLPPVHRWSSFDHFLASVGNRTGRKVLTSKDSDSPIGPDNFQWVSPRFDLSNPSEKIAWVRADRALNPDKYRARRLRRFGLSVEDYRALLERQGGVCAVCNKPETRVFGGVVTPLSVDHDHNDGAVRGLLCFSCNTALGKFRDDPTLLYTAALYVESRSIASFEANASMGFGV